MYTLAQRKEKKVTQKKKKRLVNNIKLRIIIAIFVLVRYMINMD